MKTENKSKPQNPVSKSTRKVDVASTKTKSTATEKTGSQVSSGKNAKFAPLIEQISKMNIQELNEFVQTVQDHFNIVPMAAAPVAEKSDAPASENANVVITEIGPNKIALIKALSAITGKGLMDAKKMLDNLPVTVAADKSVSEAESLKTQLEATGAVIQLK